jgi:hypothetical protein
MVIGVGIAGYMELLLKFEILVGDAGASLDETGCSFPRL